MMKLYPLFTLTQVGLCVERPDKPPHRWLVHDKTRRGMGVVVRAYLPGIFNDVLHATQHNLTDNFFLSLAENTWGENSVWIGDIG